MRSWPALAIVTFVSGCVDPSSPYRGQVYQPYPGTQAYAPSEQQLPPQPVQTVQDLAPHNYEVTKDLEVRETVPADEAWCRQPWVAMALQEVGSMRTELNQRRAHELAWQVETGPFHADLITSITGVSAGDHHCIGVSAQECRGDGRTHICRGLVEQEHRRPVWILFTIENESIDGARWRRDDTQ